MLQHNLPKSAHNQGFTLIELLVVATLVVLLLMSVSAMFMTYLVGNAQTNIRRQIKNEGNQMVNQLEYLFRNTAILTDNDAAKSAISCTNPSGTTFSLDSQGTRLVDIDNNEYILQYTSNVVTVNSNQLNTTYVVPSSPQITCYGSTANQNKSIKVNFTLQWHENGTFVDNFNTTVQLRNTQQL